MATVEQTRRPSLYELTEEWEALEWELQESGGEITPEIEERYEEQLRNMTDKAANCFRVIKRQEVSIAGYNAEIERLKHLAEQSQGVIDRIKTLLLFAMKRQELKRLDTDIGTISRQANGGKAPLELLVDADKVPEMYCRVTVSPDSEKIREAVERGDIVACDVARIGERGEHLRLR